MACLPTRTSWRPSTVAALVALLACLAGAHCGGKSTPTTPSPNTPAPPLPPTPPPPSTPVPPSAPQTFVGAGDIGWCGSAGPELTARLVEGIGGTVFTTGDNAYMSGTAKDFRNCYDPSWGRFKSRTRPVPGNHDYGTANAEPYFDYFGANAGPYGLGYYSFELGDWHAIALNSSLDVGAASAQAQWLRADLAASTKTCTIAYWHYPLFSSGPSGNQGQMRPFWKILMDFGVEVVVNGHDHMYERFAPQDEESFPNPGRGIREFVVGTGGAVLYRFGPVVPNSERRVPGVFGVLKFTLSSGSYDWQFIDGTGATLDSGSGTCH